MQFKKITPILIFVIVFSLAMTILVGKSAKKVDTAFPTVQIVNDNIVQENGTDAYVGNISSSTNENNLYTNKKFGVSFVFPSKGWYIGDNHLGYGTFQLFNYDESAASGKGFLALQNKIELTIANKLSYEQ